VNCRNAQRLIPLHAGGDLLADQVAELELHLVGCASCTAELEAYSGMRNLVSSVREPALSDSLWNGLDTRLDAVDAARRLRRRWYQSPWLYSAAAAALALAFLPPWVPATPDGAGGGVSSPPPAVLADSGETGDDSELILTPVDDFAEGLHQVPQAELQRFLRENAGLRQPTGADGGLVASPVGRKAREF